MSRFVIIGGGRTGSSHLVRLLNFYPEILCHGEAFHGRNVVHVRLRGVSEDERDSLKQELLALRNRDPFAYLERIYALGGSKRPIVGFKIFERHNQEILAHVVENPEIRKVVLFRANGLARYASLMTAHETGEWGSGSTRPPIHFNEEAFREQYDEYVEFIASTVRALVSGGQPFRILRYDEINNDTVMTALVHFLGATASIRGAPVHASGRGAPNIISRFSNPADVETFLRDRGLMHWAYEGDTSFALLSVPQS